MINRITLTYKAEYLYMVMSSVAYVTKKTFNIESNIVKRMEKLIPSRKQTEFVNKAIEELLKQKEKENARQKLFNMIDDIKAVKADKSSLDMIREIRDKRSSK